MTTPTLELADEPSDDHEGRVPPPLPPADPDAWYAEDVRAQREIHPGVVSLSCLVGARKTTLMNAHI